MKTILVISTIICFSTYAATWEKVAIPGAKCGNGKTYNVFVRKGDPHKLAVGFSGGGACWDYFTCIAPTAITPRRPLSKFKYKHAVYSEDPKVSPVATYTHLYLPYCTGDVFMMKHKAKYLGNTMYHYGRINMELTLAHLFKEGIIDFDTISHTVLFGHSAGAVGALGNIRLFDDYLPSNSQKALVSDAPGLHFGSRFWNKWTKKQMVDFKSAFARIGMEVNKKDGLVAKQMLYYCHYFPDWTISFLQGSKDFVMSVIFGNITPNYHRSLVYGKKGLLATTKDPNDKCVSWVADTMKHTFLNSNSAMKTKVDGKSAMDFFKDVVNGVAGGNYKAGSSIREGT